MSSRGDIESRMDDNEDRDRATTISAALHAGTKLSLFDLSWYQDYCEKRWFFKDEPVPVHWRNKNQQTIYTFRGTMLRVLDSTDHDKGSPVLVHVSYSPAENPRVVFLREANEFLRKFEPVYEATTWNKVERTTGFLPGIVA